MRSKQSKTLLIVSLSAAVLTVLTLVRWNLSAQPGQQAQQLTITEVMVGAPTPGLLSIVGRNLDNGSGLEVTLGEWPGSLAIVTVTATQIVAALPDPLPAGDYLLTVSTGSGAARQDVFDLTVGAVGPPGPPGPPGAVPQGSIILWDISADCPDGFARVGDYDGRFLVGGDSPGVLGGSNSHSHGSGTYTAPSHRHRMERWTHTPDRIDDNSGGDDYNTITGPAEGGTMTGTSAEADSRPEFATILLCRRI
jgi:hypothetical protein